MVTSGDILLFTSRSICWQFFICPRNHNAFRTALVKCPALYYADCYIPPLNVFGFDYNSENCGEAKHTVIPVCHTICSSSELIAVLVLAFCEAEPETRIVYLGGDPLKQG